jgi:hypothetical protein
MNYDLMQANGHNFAVIHLFELGKPRIGSCYHFKINILLNQLTFNITVNNKF